MDTIQLEIEPKKLERLSRDQIVVSIITRAMKEMEFAFKEHKIAHGGIEILAKVKDGIWTISYGRQLHKQAANIKD